MLSRSVMHGSKSGFRNPKPDRKQNPDPGRFGLRHSDFVRHSALLPFPPPFLEALSRDRWQVAGPGPAVRRVEPRALDEPMEHLADTPALREPATRGRGRWR